MMVRWLARGGSALETGREQVRVQAIGQIPDACVRIQLSVSTNKYSSKVLWLRHT